MELEQESVPSVSGIAKLKEIAVSVGDIVPILGSVKMLIEAIMGQTMRGFKLNALERAAYVSAVSFNVGVLHTLATFSHKRDVQSTGAMTASFMAGSFLSAVVGKWRHTGGLIPVSKLMPAVDSLKTMAWEFITEE